MKRKSRPSARMAGEQDEDFELRLSGVLKERFKACTKQRPGQPKTSMSSVVRDIFIEAYCDFVEAHEHQPRDFSELATWHLARAKKTKKKKP